MKKLLLTLFLIAGCWFANAQWSDNPTENNLITPLGKAVRDIDMLASKDGNVFITYLQQLNGNTASILQVVDKNGNMLFPAEGLVVSNKKTITWSLVGDMMFVDREGNAIVVVTDCRNADNDYDISYSLYKVSATGEMLWGKDGVDLANGVAFDLVHNMQIVQLEDGSYVCSYAITNFDNQTHIRMQRLSANGEFLWGDEGIIIQDNSVTYEYPYLVSAGNNQVILVFARGAGRHLTARKIDFDGSNAWATDVTIYSGGFTIPPLQVIIRVIPDQMGGAFVGWYDDRNWTNKESTYVSHVTTDGKLGFASGEGGERIGYSEELRGFAPAMYFAKEESMLYVAWRETTSGQSYQRMTAQKVKIPSGELMWDPEGVEVTPMKEPLSISSYSVQNDGEGNMAVFYSKSYGWAEDINSVTLINKNGEHVWKEEIVDFANCIGLKSRLSSTSLINNNFWVAGWDDERKIEGDMDGNTKIYLQRINKDGTLGNNGAGVKVHNMAATFTVAPTIVDGYANFYINTEKTSVADITLYSIMGQKMETIYSGILPNGDNMITWNAQKSKLSKGIYIATLTMDSGNKSLRIIVN